MVWEHRPVARFILFALVARVPVGTYGVAASFREEAGQHEVSFRRDVGDPRGTLNLVNARYGAEPDVKAYPHVSGRFSLFTTCPH